MRVGILGLLQESNTFLTSRTTIEHFRQDTLLVGEAIGDRFAGAHHEVGGFFGGLEEAGVDAAPVFLARALPFGAISSETSRRLLDMMLAELHARLPLDGVLVACHGADTAEDEPDVDGQWLSHVRKCVGPKVPVIATVDPHGNLSQRMIDNTDAMIAYRTNPHTDQRACGQRAAAIMAGTLAGDVQPTQHACFPPMVINIERQLTAEPPLRAHYDAADQMLAEPGVLSNSIMLGFPYADVPEMGSAVIAVTDNDRPKARTLASRMARQLWRDRRQFIGQLIDVDTAIETARQLDGPVCLLDMGDNVGGGSPGDGTILLRALHRARLGPAVVCLYDPAAARAARNAGVGSRVNLSVGGKTDARHGEPLPATFTVVALSDGRFGEPEPRHGGFTSFDQGPSAVVTTDDRMTVVLTSRRMAPFSLGQLTCCQIDPASQRVLVAKGVHAPVAAYQSVCKHFIRVNTPGVTTADLSQLHYQHRRCPLFPFEREFNWQP